MRYSSALKALMLDAFDATFNNERISAWSGAEPASSDAAATGTMIAQSAALPADFLAAAVAGAAGSDSATKSKNATNPALTGLAAAGAGTAMGYFRIHANADAQALVNTAARLQGTIGVPGATTAITAIVAAGGLVTITANGHGLTDGQLVEIQGHGVAAYNRKFRVYNATANTIQILQPEGVAPGAAAGTIRRTFHMTVDNASIANAQVATITSITTEL